MAAVSLLYSDPLHGEFETKCKLIELLVASAIHGRRQRSPGPSLNSLHSDFSAYEFLEQHGLQLVEPISSILLQEAVRGMPPMTVDYAQFMRTQLNYDLRINSRIKRRLRALDVATVERALTDDFHWIGPERSESEDSFDSEYDDPDDSRSRKHLRFDPLDEEPDPLALRLSVFFIQCYPGNISTMKFCVTKAHLFLPMADKMSQLATLELGRKQGYSIPKPYFKDTIAFVIDNKTAYPEKRPIHLRFSDEWEREERCDIHSDEDYLSDDGSEHWDGSCDENYSTDDELEYYQAGKITRREYNRQYQEPMVALYEALGTPMKLEVSRCPGFYRDIAETLDLDFLQTFVDKDSSRFESSDQQAFLKRCKNVRKLDIAVSHPQLFSWPLRWKWNGTAQPQQETPLGKLQDLTLHIATDFDALNVAMGAVGQTVQTLWVDSCAQQNSRLAWLQRRARIGGWNLPCIRTISITSDNMFQVYLGNFNECPLLETLRLNFKFSDIPVVGEKDAHYRVSIAPIWKLPCLRTLELHEAAALVFNYGTLDHVQRLESLTLCYSSSATVPSSAVTVPRLCLYSRRLQPCGKREEPLYDNSGKPWKDQWNLPSLRSLKLSGVPSSVFCFHWLTECPLLETLTLDTAGVPRRLPLLSSSKSSAIIPKLTVSSFQLQRPLVGKYDEDLASGSSLELKPLLDSKLRTLALKGCWIMSEEALITALAYYAPNLSMLRVECPGQRGGSNSAALLVRWILRAEVFKQNWRQTGHELEDNGTTAKKPKMKVESNCGLQDKDIADLHLVSISKKIWDRWPQYYLDQTFSLGGEYYRHSEDGCMLPSISD